MRKLLERVAREVRIAGLVLRDPRTPWASRILLGCCVAYFLSPIDLIPDFIPVLGQLDDAVIVPLLLFAGLALVPAEVIREHRAGEGARP
ncbi:MAG: YkvA family protein [Candidatus Eiseniibacteriota bacterium]